MKNATELIKERFNDKEFKKAYYRSAPFYRLADELLLLRKKRGLSQKELAEAAGTTQAVVSRLENASVKASLESVVKFAEALDAFVNVRLIPLEEASKELVNETEINYQKEQELQKDLRINYFFQFNREPDHFKKNTLEIDLIKIPSFSFTSEISKNGELV